MAGKNWECKNCGFELVEISKENLLLSIKELKPIIKSVQKNWQRQKGEYIKICPQCDAYTLGIEMEKGYPIRDKYHQVTKIQEMESHLWK